MAALIPGTTSTATPGKLHSSSKMAFAIISHAAFLAFEHLKISDHGMVHRKWPGTNVSRLSAASSAASSSVSGSPLRL